MEIDMPKLCNNCTNEAICKYKESTTKFIEDNNILSIECPENLQINCLCKHYRSVGSGAIRTWASSSSVSEDFFYE